jgi:hypothetical protein
LTRLPAPHRLAPEPAYVPIEANFMGGAVATLDAQGHRDLLRRAVQVGTAGGQIYDAVIVACARSAGVETILTFNARHFLHLVHPDVSVGRAGCPAGAVKDT